MNYVRPELMVLPPFPTPIPKMNRFERAMYWRGIDKWGLDGCWYWTGQYTPRPLFGLIWLRGQLHVTHRIAYYLHTGIDPLDHGISFLCFHTGCCNPDHLELVSPFYHGELHE